MRERRNPADAKLAKGKKIKEVEKAPGNERAPTFPVPDVPRTEEGRAMAVTLATVVNAMIDPVFVLDLEGRCVFANRAYFQMFGLDPNDIMGKSIMEIPGVEKQKPEEVKKFMPLIREAIERGSAGPVEIVLVAMDDREIPLSVAGGVIKDAQGNPIYLTAVLRDITELKRAEEQLRESEERYRTLFESTADGILVADIQTRKFKFANPAICRMLGYSEEELKRMGVDDIHPKYALEQVISEFNAQARGEKILAPNIPCLRKDGTIVYADIDATKALFDGRECNIGFFRDITERKRAEEELQKRAIIIDSTTDAVITTDLKGNIIFCNKGAELMYGYTAKEMIGNPIAILYPKQELSKLGKIIENLLKCRKIPSIEVTVKHKNKKLLPIIMSMTPIKDENGKVIELVGIAQDITERKRAEEALRKRTHDLGERVKELNCLYSISDLVAKPDISLEDIFQGTIALIPPALRYSEITCARIIVEGKEYKTKNFKETVWKQASTIVVHGERVGAVEVYYLEERPESDESPFLEEERSLINAIAKQLGETTERKKAEEERAKAVATTAATIEGMIDVVGISDMEGRVIQINKAVENWGYKREEVIGKPVVEFLAKRSLAKLEEERKKTLKTGVLENLELIGTREDGSEIPILVNVTLMRDAEGKPIGRVFSLKDITERKQAEEEKLKIAANKQRMEELEKFAKIAVGRELKMVELKDRIKALELRLEGITEKG